MSKKLIFCIAGIYSCFLTWGLTQERVTTTEYNGRKFKYFILLNSIQALIASCIAYIYMRIKRQAPDSMSRSLVWSYLQLSLFSCAASQFGYSSLKHISYPTLILGKSCKLVPVVIMNFVLYRKIFPLEKYLVVLAITIGVSSFMLLQPAKNGKAASNSLYGLCLLGINLLIDGSTNSIQDAMFAKHKITGTSMMMYMNFFSSLIMGAYLALNPYSNELSEAASFLTANPSALYDILLFGIAGGLGQCFIFATLEGFGSIVLVTVTVTRKMVSIILSVVWFGHTLSTGQWGSVALVFSAIAYEALGKIRGKSSITKAKLEKKTQ